MKLYATITSERASKGQGGNQFLNIVITDEKRAKLLDMRIEHDETANNQAKIRCTLYTSHRSITEQFGDILKVKSLT